MEFLVFVSIDFETPIDFGIMIPIYFSYLKDIILAFPLESFRTNKSGESAEVFFGTFFWVSSQINLVEKFKGKSELNR